MKNTLMPQINSAHSYYNSHTQQAAQIRKDFEKILDKLLSNTKYLYVVHLHYTSPKISVIRDERSECSLLYVLGVNQVELERTSYNFTPLAAEA